MKVIELLTKIANGEKIPKKIKYQNYIYEYQHRRDTENCFNYMCNENGEYLSRRYFIDNILNDEVEIIEEPKKIEKIDEILMIDDLIPPCGENDIKMWKNIIIQQNKINELIDEINNLKEK